jgi:hypothetical protein
MPNKTHPAVDRTRSISPPSESFLGRSRSKAWARRDGQPVDVPVRQGTRIVVASLREAACTVVVPNLEKKSKSGKYFLKSGRGAGGSGVLGLSECEAAW